jgi:hypothetical protein
MKSHGFRAASRYDMGDIAAKLPLEILLLAGFVVG